LTSESVNSGRLCDFGGTLDDLLAALVDRRNANNEITIVHCGVLDPDGQFVAREDHSNKIDVVTTEKESAKSQA
jgi:hypothetical protein